MSEQLHTRPSSGRSLLYLSVWAMLAALALGYLALLAVRPDIASGLILGPAESTPESNRGQRAMSRALAELGEIRKTLGKVEGELVELKQKMVAETKRAAELEARLGALEAARKTEGTPMAAAPAAFQTTVSSPGRPSQALAGDAVEGSVADRTAAPAKAVASATLQRPSEPKEKGPPVGLLLATGPSVDALRLSWQLIQDQNSRQLKSLEPRYVEGTAEPGSFQLIAGPVETKEEAQRVCQRLKAKQVRCSVTPTFAGQPL